MSAADRSGGGHAAPNLGASVREAGEHYKAGRLDAAAAILETVLGHSPEFAHGWLLLDVVEGARGRFGAAGRSRPGRCRGIAAERLFAAARLPFDQHVARLAQADLFVDTYPYNGHTSASDALWAGVPVLTRMGPTFASRVAASLVRAAGVPELVTDSLEAYRRRLLELVADRTALATIKQRLAEVRATARLFDSQRYTRGLERAYQEMWRKHASGQKPGHIVIQDD